MNIAKTYIKDLIIGKNVATQYINQLFECFHHIPLSQQGALLALLAAKKETTEELMGAVRYLQSQGMAIDYEKEIIDIVGTGGDGCRTFNISTAASLVVASCGVKVAKHGGRAVTSQAGSADVLAQLKIPFYESTEQILQSLDQNNFTFLWAPLFNPALKALGQLRKELGFPTLLNILGPLVNPLRPKRLLIGVYREDLVVKIATILRDIDVHHAMVVHSMDGMDEISISAPTRVAYLRDGQIKTSTLTPESVGLSRAPIEAVVGGTPQENAQIIHEIFSGKPGPAMDIVLVNAAAGLLIADKVNDLKEGVAMARQAILTGKVAALLKRIQGGNHER